MYDYYMVDIILHTNWQRGGGGSSPDSKASKPKGLGRKRKHSEELPWDQQRQTAAQALAENFIESLLCTLGTSSVLFCFSS